MKRAAIERIYVPKFCENREAEEKDQVTVEMDLATRKELDQFSIMKSCKGGKVEHIKKEYTALRKKVKSINNYFDETGTPIDTADKLIQDMEKGAYESIRLCGELWNILMGYETKEDDEEAEGTDSEDTQEFTEGED